MITLPNVIIAVIVWASIFHDVLTTKLPNGIILGP